MKVTYDSNRNIAYIRLHEKQGSVDTVHVSDALNVDMAPDGTVYGIELLNANEQLCAEADGHLVAVSKIGASMSEEPLTVYEEPGEYRAKK